MSTPHPQDHMSSAALLSPPELLLLHVHQQVAAQPAGGAAAARQLQVREAAGRGRACCEQSWCQTQTPSSRKAAAGCCSCRQQHRVLPPTTALAGGSHSLPGALHRPQAPPAAVLPLLAAAKLLQLGQGALQGAAAARAVGGVWPLASKPRQPCAADRADRCIRIAADWRAPVAPGAPKAAWSWWWHVPLPPRRLASHGGDPKTPGGVENSDVRRPRPPHIHALVCGAV